MRKLLVAIPLLAAIILFSCQKELNFDKGSGGGGAPTGNTLVKTISKTVTDSVITLYTYNNNKRLVNQTITGTQQGVDAGNEFRYYRNSSGVITRYVQINPNLVLAGIDSLITIVRYDAVASKYTSTITDISLFGFSVTDSTALVYDASGKVIRNDIYQSIPLIGGYMIALRIKYTYAANGNVTQVDTYNSTSGTDKLVSTVKYTFDAKTSALNPGIMFLNKGEPFAILRGDWVSVNNATKMEIIDVATPANSQTSLVSYTYNSNNRPVKGANSRGAAVDSLFYYYQ